MTKTRTAICLGIILRLGVSPALFAEKVPEKLMIPPEFLSTSPEIPAEQNNLTPFLTTLEPSWRDLTKDVREARNQLAAGKPVTDESLLQKLREQNKQANDQLKPPLAFTSDASSSGSLPLYSLFQGTAVLARQAMLDHD